MKRFLKSVRDNGGAMALLVNGVNLLPFAGIALLFSADAVAIAFGIVFLLLGLLMWTITFNN